MIPAILIDGVPDAQRMRSAQAELEAVAAALAPLPAGEQRAITVVIDSEELGGLQYGLVHEVSGAV